MRLRFCTFIFSAVKCHVLARFLSCCVRVDGEGDYMTVHPPQRFSRLIYPSDSTIQVNRCNKKDAKTINSFHFETWCMCLSTFCFDFFPAFSWNNPRVIAKPFFSVHRCSIAFLVRRVESDVSLSIFFLVLYFLRAPLRWRAST